MPPRFQGELPIGLAGVLPEAQACGPSDIRIASCAGDPSAVRPGDVFVARKTAGLDGHDHIAEAAQRGCQAIVAEEPVAAGAVPVFYVTDSRRAYSRLCQALAGDPSRQLKVVGIAGHAGKTTTGCLVASVLSTAGYRAGLMGTLGGFDGEQFGHVNRAMQPEELATWMSRMVKRDCTHAVLEVPGQAIDRGHFGGVDFDITAVTGLGHGSLADRRRGERYADYLASDGLALLNADDDGCQALVARFDGPALTIGIDSAAEITAVVLEQGMSEQTFLLCAGSESVPVRTRMIGTHHIYNCLMAAAVGLAYDIELVTVARGLEKVDRLPGRLERIECGQPFAVFVDAAETPSALARALECLRHWTRGRLICVASGSGDLEGSRRPRMARIAEEHSELVVLTAGGWQSENGWKTVGAMLAGMRRPDRAKVTPDRAEAIAWALGTAAPGDCVLITGQAGHRAEPASSAMQSLDDRDFTRAWLYEHQPGARMVRMR